MRKILYLSIGIFAQLHVANAYSICRFDNDSPVIKNQDIKTHGNHPLGHGSIFIDSSLNEIVISIPDYTGFENVYITNVETGETYVYTMPFATTRFPLPASNGIWMVTVEENGIIRYVEFLSI